MNYEGLYLFSLAQTHPNPNVAQYFKNKASAPAASTTSLSSNSFIQSLWHNRLGYPSFSAAINKILQYCNIPFSNTIKTHSVVCHSCDVGNINYIFPILRPHIQNHLK